MFEYHGKKWLEDCFAYYALPTKYKNVHDSNRYKPFKVTFKRLENFIQFKISRNDLETAFDSKVKKNLRNFIDENLPKVQKNLEASSDHETHSVSICYTGRNIFGVLTVGFLGGTAYLYKSCDSYKLALTSGGVAATLASSILTGILYKKAKMHERYAREFTTWNTDISTIEKSKEE